MILRDRRALSPVISGIILIAVTVAVAIAATTWMGSMTSSFMSIEEIKITNCQWASDFSYADLSVNNFGTSSATINEVKVNGNSASNVTIISGNSTVEAGETSVLRVIQIFSQYTKYEFVISTTRGTNVAFISSSVSGDQSFAYNHYVNTTSNIDGLSDKGTHSNFANQRTGPDSIFDTLTETDTGGEAVIKVEHVQFDFGTGGSTTSITDVGDLNKSFFRNNVARRTSAGPTGSSSSTNWNVFSAGAQLTATNELTGYRATGQTAPVRIRGEVWRYIGTAGGPNEFIVRWRGVVTIASGSKTGSQAVSGISDRDNCVPFVQGVIGNINSRNDGNRVVSHAHIDFNDNLIVERGETGTEVQVYVVVIEFTGSNWNVGHALGSLFSRGSNNVALFDGSDGTGNSFDVGDWDTAFIEASMSGDISGDHALEDTGFVVEPQSGSTTGVTITFDNTAGLGGTEVFVHVIQNDNIYVNRYTDSQSIPASDNHAVVGLTRLDESALEWYVFTDGGGTAYARGATGAYLTSTTNVAEWTHRTGNTGTYRFGVINLSGLVDTNYELDLEIQCSDVNVSNNYDKISIFTGLASGENLDVYIWNGASWDILIANLASNQWNNATRSITEETVILRFLGTSEINDTTQDTWEIDCVLLNNSD